MNHLIRYSNSVHNPLRRKVLSCVGACVLLLIGLASRPAVAADASGLADKAKAAAQETTAAVENAGRAVATDAEKLWQRIDTARLKNRTPDEIVAWVIMGVLVGSVAGMMTSLKTTGADKFGRLLLGLAGAFLGGIVVSVTRLDFGWGPVLIRYEELAVSLLGAIVLILLVQFIRSRTKKKTTG